MQHQAAAGVEGLHGLGRGVVAQAPGGDFEGGAGGARGRLRGVAGAGLEEGGPGMAAEGVEAGAAGRRVVAAEEVGAREREARVGVEAVLGAARTSA